MRADTFNKIVVWTSVFSITIFFIDVSFFGKNNNELIEKEYIEKQLPKENIVKIEDKKINDNISINKNKEEINRKEILEKIQKKQKEYQEKILLEKEEELLNSAPVINVKYIDEDFEYRVNKEIVISFYSVFKSNIFNWFFDEININLNEKKSDIRWKMSKRTLRMYWVNILWRNEFTSVFIHEFGHFIDLYYFNNFLNTDISNKFYNISWDWTKVIKPGLSVNDFVSWYSMTNKYEDFAESFTYYVLHNWDFLNKLKKSDILEKKYEFFSNYVFKDNSFLSSNFSSEELLLKDYYWDITKIDINFKKFLNYIKK